MFASGGYDNTLKLWELTATVGNPSKLSRANAPCKRKQGRTVTRFWGGLEVGFLGRRGGRLDFGFLREVRDSIFNAKICFKSNEILKFLKNYMYLLQFV